MKKSHGIEQKKKYTIKDIDVFVMTRNRADFLCEALTSVLKQTVRPDVVTVFDNESTDNTRDAVRRFHDKGVRYVRTTGRIGNFLAMQKWSKRPFVVHLHDDNLLHPDYFEKVLTALNAIDNVAGVTGAYTYFRTSVEGHYMISNGYRLMDDFLILEDKQSFVIHKVRAESPPYDIIVDNIGALVYRSDYFRQRVSMTHKYGKGDDLEVCMSLLAYGKLVTVSDRNGIMIREHAKRDVNNDDNSMTLDQAFNWLGLYIDAARQIKSRRFWRQFISMIYTQYPYFVKRAVYKAIPTRNFCAKVMEHFSLPYRAEEVFRDYLSRKIPMLQHEEYADECNRQHWSLFWVLRQVGKFILPYHLILVLKPYRGRSSFWALRQIGKYILPYNLVLILKRIRHHI